MTGANTPLYRLVSVLLAIALFVGFPSASANAQYIGSSRDLRKDRSYEGDDVDYTELYEQRRSNSALQDRIVELDDNSVEDLFVPILFGVALDDIAPNFGDPRGSGTRMHEGLDMLAARGTPAISPTEAVVLRVGNGKSSGKYVSTANPGDETFVYMHLDEIGVEVGDVLAAGDLVGFVGDTGNALGGPAHLHFEVRDGRRATDPYSRITKELSLKQKLALLDDMLDSYDDASDLAAFLADEYSGVFIQARVENLDLPRRIERLLLDEVAIASRDARDLAVGAEGADVSTLQSILIVEGHLTIDTPTGYFGPLTKAALVSYQRKLGVKPATGYFGPLTRAAMSPAREFASISPMSPGDMSLEDVVRLLLALDIIPVGKKELAFSALRAIEAETT